jgi:hypothetical protein
MKRAGAACIAIVASLCAATLDAQRLVPAVLTRVVAKSKGRSPWQERSLSVLV